MQWEELQLIHEVQLIRGTEDKQEKNLFWLTEKVALWTLVGQRSRADSSFSCIFVFGVPIFTMYIIPWQKLSSQPSFCCWSDVWTSAVFFLLWQIVCFEFVLFQVIDMQNNCRIYLSCQRQIKSYRLQTDARTCSLTTRFYICTFWAWMRIWRL